MLGKLVAIIGTMVGAPIVAGFFSPALQTFLWGIDGGIILTIIGGAVYLYRKMTQLGNLTKDLEKTLKDAGINLGEEED